MLLLLLAGFVYMSSFELLMLQHGFDWSRELSKDPSILFFSLAGQLVTCNIPMAPFFTADWMPQFPKDPSTCSSLHTGLYMSSFDDILLLSAGWDSGSDWSTDIGGPISGSFTHPSQSQPHSSQDGRR